MDILATLQAYPAAVLCLAGIAALVLGLVVWVVDVMGRYQGR